MGGGNGGCAGRAVGDIGLSPRGRGKLSYEYGSGNNIGSIPAWAGETVAAVVRVVPFRVYPRVGGGNARRNYEPRRRYGLSPRGRGKPRSRKMAVKVVRSIPAWAGETSRQPLSWMSSEVYPRVGGGNELEKVNGRIGGGLSPRGRGKLQRRGRRHRLGRSIPAWAGETAAGACLHLPGEVYPRVGGGNGRDIDHRRESGGLSPRGRGKLHPAQVIAEQRRSIPAWAGETRA